MDAISVSSDESVGSPRSASPALESRVPTDLDAEKTKSYESRSKTPSVSSSPAEAVVDGKSHVKDESPETTSIAFKWETRMEQPLDSGAEQPDICGSQSKWPIVPSLKTEAAGEETSLGDAPAKTSSDSQFPFFRAPSHDHSYYHSGDNANRGKSIKSSPHALRNPLPPNIKSACFPLQSSSLPLIVTSTVTQSSATPSVVPPSFTTPSVIPSSATPSVIPSSSTVPSMVMPAVAFKVNERLYIYPAKLVPYSPPSSGPVNICFKSNPTVAPLSTRTAPVGKVDSHNVPPRTTALASKATAKSLEVPGLLGVSSNVETAHAGGKDTTKSNQPNTRREQVSLNMHTYGSKLSNARITPRMPGEPSVHKLSKSSQTDSDPSESVHFIKRKVIEFERKAENLEYRLARAALKQSETVKRFSVVRKYLARSKKSIAKHKETIEDRKKDIEMLQVKNRLLQEELDKLKPKPRKPRPVKVYMPSDMLGSGTNNWELGQGKPIEDGKIVTFQLPCDVQPDANNVVEGDTADPSSTNVPKSGGSDKRKLPRVSAPKKTSSSGLPFKKPCLSSTRNTANEKSHLNVESTTADDGTIVYNLKPTAKVKLKPKSLPGQSTSVQIDESEFRTIETVTDEGDVAYHLLRSPQKPFKPQRRDLAQNAGYQINEDVKAVEVILSLEEGLAEE